MKLRTARTLIGAANISAIALLAAGTAHAQEVPSVAPASDQTATDDKNTIVVTGSRLRRDNFNTPSQVNVVTRDDTILAGARSTAEVLQSSSVTSGTSQINGSYLGFVSEGGPAANTVGLRGLGSSRTLILLNGRRVAPAGAGPQLVSADLNVLPTAIVARTEILREGASSVYGSDAIAGVINIITDTKIDGLTLDAYTNQPIEHGGGGRDYRLSAVMGKTFDRGHITAAFEYNENTGMRVGDRSEFSCPHDLYYDQTTGKEVGQIDPATGKLMCFPYVTGASGTASGYGIAIGSAGLNRLTYANGDINTLRIGNGLTRASPSPTQLRDHIISPIRTYTGYVNASYELGILGDAEIYAEGLFTRRESRQDATYQINIDQQQLSPNIEIYGGSYLGTPLSAYGYPTSPFFPNSLANAGYFYFTPFIIPDRPYENSQRVDFARGNIGLKGNTGIGDWRYDANFQYSRTTARYSSTLIEKDHLSNALQTVLAPAGTPDNLVTVALPGQFGAGNRYTCASNVSGGAIVSGASCVPLNMYDPNILIGGHLPQNVYDYLFTNEVGHTTFQESIISLNADGSLFSLPAGDVKASIGYEHRNDRINDEPSLAARTGNLYNYSSAGITKGSDTVDEIYGEVGIPLIKEKPFFYDLDLNLSGRWTHYKSYGSQFTYHINGNWAPIEAIRFRGNYGTSYRAPNLYEQYVADQTGFYGAAVDPCYDMGSKDPSSTVYKNCFAALSPIIGAAAAATYIPQSGPQVTTRGGHGGLSAEKSTAWGLGVVLTAPKEVADLSLAIDYWNIEVRGEVYTLGNLILNRCYEATDFATSPYCALIDPRRGASDAHPGDLASFLNPYLNIAKQKASGIDFDLRYGYDLGGGRLLAKVQATRNIHQQFQLFDTDPVDEYNGTLGVQGAGAGPKWVGNAELDYTFPGDRVTVRYGVKYVGKQDSSGGNGTATPGFGLGTVNVDLVAEEYWEHSISMQIKWKDVGQVTFGVTNLFNALPPIISGYPTSDGQFTRVGNYFNSSNYDLVGRSMFLNITRSFK